MLPCEMARYIAGFPPEARKYGWFLRARSRVSAGLSYDVRTGTEWSQRPLIGLRSFLQQNIRIMPRCMNPQNLEAFDTTSETGSAVSQRQTAGANSAERRGHATPQQP